jgi:hypothetical protein
MKMRVFAVALVGMTMGLGASAGLATQESVPPLQKDGSTNPKSITLTGCVAQGTPAGTYTLTTSTPKAEATDKDAKKPMTLILTGTDVDLSPHVGHEVSVTGQHAVPAAIGTTGVAGSEKPAAGVAVKDDDKKPTGTFTVKSLKMVATSCTPPAN